MVSTKQPQKQNSSTPTPSRGAPLAARSAPNGRTSAGGKVLRKLAASTRRDFEARAELVGIDLRDVIEGLPRDSEGRIVEPVASIRERLEQLEVVQ